MKIVSYIRKYYPDICHVALAHGARRLAGSLHLTSPLLSLREPTGGNSLGRPVAREIGQRTRV